MTAAGLVVRSLWRHPARSLGCILAVGVGAATYLLLAGSTQAFLQQFARISRLLGADIVVHRSRATAPWSSTLTPAEVETLRSVPGVRRTLPVTLAKTDVLGDHFFLIFGLDPPPTLSGELRELVGRLPAAGSEEIAVGFLAKERLGLKLGETFDIHGKKPRLVGFFRSGHSLFDHGALAPLSFVQSLFNFGQNVSFVLVTVDPSVKPAELAASIAGRQQGLEASTVDMWVSLYGEFHLVETYVQTVALICLVIAMLSVGSVLQVSLIVRASEFAILRAIGWSRMRVTGLVLLETAALALVGAALAPLVGELLLQILEPLNTETAGFVADHVNPRLIPKTILVTLAASPLGALFPAVRLLRMTPARVLQLP